MAVLIKNNGDESDVKLDNLKQMQDLVEGRIHFINLQGHNVLIVNKDAFVQELRYNAKASKIANEVVCGNAILCEKHEIY